MKSIFNAANNAELILRINQLTEKTPAQWGKMNPAQMMAHCQVGVNIALGNSPNVRTWIGVLFGNFTKRRMLKAPVLDRNIPTFKQAEITDERNFEEEKKKFIALLQTALVKGQPGLIKCPHPYFRHFKNDEWSQLNWKHLDHHLRQFGVSILPLAVGMII